MTNLFNIKQEVVQFLRNQDIFTTTVRGVTTTTDTGTFSGATTHLIAVSNGKNIRTVVVDSITLTFGDDYTYSTQYNDAGTIKIKITFNSAQTGDYTITYDYGTDKIFPDFPKDSLSISSYPRIATDIISSTTDAFGIGGSSFLSSYILTVVVYDDSSRDIENYISTIKQKFINNAKNFYYMSFIKPIGMGPLINSKEKNNEILQRNIDFQIMFDVEESA